MENKELTPENGQADPAESPINEENTKNTTTDASKEDEVKPSENGETEGESTGKESDKNIIEDNTEETKTTENITEENKEPESSSESIETDDSTRPVEEPSIQTSERPGRTTRGTKRKAEAEKSESSVELTSSETISETVEHKENLDSKNSENLLTDDSSLQSLSDRDSMGKGKRARIPNKRYSDILLTPNKKSSNQSKQQEAADIEITIKEEPLDSLVYTNVGSPSLPSKKLRNSLPKENLQDPKYLKPFKYGWKRELVWRSTSTASKPIGDIYYYSPSGKKVRSFRELSDHLTNKSLSMENFSYTKEPLGIDDPEKEIIRSAKISRSSESIETPPPKKAEVKKPKKVLSPKSSVSDSPKVNTPVNRKIDTPIVKETPPSPSKRAQKMPAKKAKTPPAKKPKLTPVKAEELVEVAPSPPARASTIKTRSNQNNSVVKLKKRNLKVKSITNTSTATPEEKNEAKFMENYLQNLSFGYNTLLYVFQYLKVQDLLRAGCVCTMWRDIASHSVLWRTVRMKNSQVHSFEGLANTLKKHGTVHLDLRKMLLPSSGDEIWPEFSSAIAKVDTLKKIELCRCPASVVEQLATSNTNLEVINAVTIKCESMNLDPFKALTCIRELRLKSTSGLNINSIDSLKELKTLKILSLTSVNDLSKLNLEVIAELTSLESLDLGECTDFPKSFGQDILAKLDNLEKLRLEKGQGNCHTFEILEAVKGMKKLEQLELVNFDVKSGFDKALGQCTNIKKLMIIPTYISQSATTNNMVLSGVLRLQGSLTHFVWGVTLELLRVTELFVDQCEDFTKKEKKPSGNGDSIPVLKPVPDLSHGGDIQAASNPPQVEILPLPNLQKLLLNSLPTTRVKILKIPFHATWRQTLTDSV